MKIDRLLAITTYLMNRDLVSGKQLADKFGVSERTIQRDIDTIGLTGIPITSIRGANGGYKILDTYRLSKQTATEKDFESILLALKSLNSILENDRISNALEKVISIAPTSASANINIDFGVAKENKKVVAYIKTIEEAILNKRQLNITYSNANNDVTTRAVEPISLEFKWYAWYLAAYCTAKKEPRIFKLARITQLEQTDVPFLSIHHQSPELFEDLMKKDSRRPMDIVFKGASEIFTAVSEYLPGVDLVENKEDYFIAKLTVMENERMWFGFVLSFGEDIEIIEPQHLQCKLIEHCKKIINKYEIPDR